MGGGWKAVQTVLPEPLSAGQVLPGPQNAVLRRGALSLLRDDDRSATSRDATRSATSAR